jgi:hypothetical protein
MGRPFRVAGDGPGNWGEGRMAQQAPADIEHDFAGELCSSTVERQNLANDGSVVTSEHSYKCGSVHSLRQKTI